MATVDLDDDRLRSCISKVKAHKILTKSPYKKVLVVYHCRYCGQYHLGHKSAHLKD